MFEGLFSGTLNRAPWWAFWIIGNTIILGCYIYSLMGVSGMGSAFGVLLILLLTIFAQLVASSKRLRQAGFSPYLSLLMFVPFGGGLALTIMAGFFAPRY